MPETRKRSRRQTEQRFQDAVLDLVAESGFAEIGINIVAERAGADKVLIYRYFGDFEGLLQRVAESRTWLPSADELLGRSAHTPKQRLKDLFKHLSTPIRNDAATHQTALWQHAEVNPLTQKYRLEWKTLWKQLGEELSNNLPYEERKKWNSAIELLAMVTHSKIVGEQVDESWIDFLSQELEPVDPQMNVSMVQEDVLPTNLL